MDIQREDTARLSDIASTNGRRRGPFDSRYRQPRVGDCICRSWRIRKDMGLTPVELLQAKRRFSWAYNERDDSRHDNYRDLHTSRSDIDTRDGDPDRTAERRGNRRTRPHRT